MNEKQKIRAKVTFITPDQGGRKTPARSGTRSELKVNDVFTTCVVRGETDEQVFEFGIEYDVIIELMFWDRYKGLIHADMPIQLNEGSRPVGFGRVKAIEGD